MEIVIYDTVHCTEDFKHTAMMHVDFKWNLRNNIVHKYKRIYVNILADSVKMR